MSRPYARYMDKSLDEMAAEMHYPSDSSLHPSQREPAYRQTEPDYDSKQLKIVDVEEEEYRDRATTRYLPYTDSYADGGERKTDTERRGRRDGACTLFVSNLKYETNWQELKDHMKKVGGVERCDVFKDARGLSKGVGQCVFVDEESMERALRELNETMLDGRRIKLRKASSHSDREREPMGTSMSRRRAKPPQDPACTVFVHNLDYAVTWQKLKDIFKVIGPVMDVELMDNHKGNAMVQFTCADDAIKAIALFHGQMLMDRPMRLRMDSKAPYQPDPLKLKLANLHSDHSPPRRRRSPSPDRSYLSLGRDRDYGDDLRGYDSSRSLEAKVRKELAEVAYLKELTLSRDRDRDDHYSRLREPDRRYSDTRSRSHDRRFARSRSRSRSRERRWSDGRGRGRMERNSELSDDQITSVFVRNLAFRTSWQTLKDEFRSAGSVKRADVKTDRDGRSSGCAVVYFETHRGASSAIDMFNDKVFDGRRIEVRYDRASHPK